MNSISLNPFKQTVLEIERKINTCNLEQLITELFNNYSEKNKCSEEEYFSRINLYKKDIIYLSKKFNLEEIFYKLISSRNGLYSFFYLERGIMLQYKEPINYRKPMSKVIETWLRKKTCFHEICAKREKVDSFKIFIHPKFSLRLKKRQIKDLFLSIGRSLSVRRVDLDKWACLLPTKVGERQAFFIVYPQKNHRLTLLFSKVSAEFLVGVGSHAIALEAIDLNSFKSFALKYPRYNPSKAINPTKIYIENEIVKLLHWGKLGNPVKAVIDHKILPAFITSLKPGNALHFLDSLNENSGYTLNDLIRGLLPVLESLKTLNEEGISHNDIKPDNLLYATKKGLKFILNDFGLSLSHKKILEMEYYKRYNIRFHLERDAIALENEALQGNFEKCCEIIQKQEVYALGKTLLEIIFNQHMIFTDFALAIDKKLFLEVFQSQKLFSIINEMLQLEHEQRADFKKATELFKEFLTEEGNHLNLYQCQKQASELAVNPPAKNVREDIKDIITAPINLEFPSELDFTPFTVE